MVRICVELLGAFLVVGPMLAGVGAGSEDTKATSFAGRYTKREYRIPMRDGVELFTIVYTPKEKPASYPILLIRTPYSLKPYTVDADQSLRSVPEGMIQEKFIFALQDVRGRYASGGEFVHVRPHLENKSGPKATDESTDTWDTIDWMVKHIPGNNGRVGLTGISYPGFYAAAGMIDSHPALKAVSPQAPVAALLDGDDTLHGGCFWLCHNWGFMYAFEQKLEDPTRQEPRGFDFGTPDGYRFFLGGGSLGELETRHFRGRVAFWDDLMAHAGEAEWCAARDISRHLKNIHAAVLTVGGWFDAEDLSGTLKTYRAVEANNPGIFNALVMGPWSHGQWHGGEGKSLGPIHFHAKTAEFFRESIELPFFRRFLKDDTNAVALPEAYVFETGTDEWRQESSWPPAGARPTVLYFRDGGVLSFEPPGATDAGYDEYISDPAHPVPFTQQIDTDMPGEYMVEDQRFAATRPDVLVYQTQPLREEVTLAGPITASLHVSTSGTDADWVVKLIDVYTDGAPNPEPNPGNLQLGHYQQLVRGEPQRGKYRDGYGHPQPFEPGKVAKVEWVMPDVCHTFRTGHRIMVQVQSSWFPLMDRNPQTYCDIYHARAIDYQKATHRVHRAAGAASSVQVMVVSGK
jgi:putative CocE/NonD family hydrolase